MIKDLELQLRQYHIKPTSMRLLVLEYLNGKDVAVGLSQLYADFEKSDRVTLYRTLKVFEEKGLVHSIDDGTGVPKYAVNVGSDRSKVERDLHIHFHCRICGNTFCLTKYQIPEIKLPPHYRAEEANLVVKGVCEKCA